MYGVEFLKYYLFIFIYYLFINVYHTICQSRCEEIWSSSEKGKPLIALVCSFCTRAIKMLVFKRKSVQFLVVTFQKFTSLKDLG